MKLQELHEAKDDSLLDTIEKQEFKKSNGTITADGKRVKVVFLTKQEYFDSHDATVEFTYIINPATHAWSFRAGLPGGEDVEFANGEDESTLLKHLKRKTKIKPSAIDEYLTEEVLKTEWREQTEKELKQEFDYEYALPKRRWDMRAEQIGAKYPIFDSLDDFVEKVKAAPVQVIKHADYHKVRNLTSLETLDDVKEMTSSYSYPRDVDSIVTGFKAKSPMPYPIIIKGKSGMWILSGNTRMNVAKILGIEGRAKVVDAS